MKRIIAIATILMIMTTLTGCRIGVIELPPDIDEQQSGDMGISGGPDADILPVAGKIAVITNLHGHNPEAYFVAESFVRRFGEEQVVHMTWPADGSERAISDILQGISEDPEIGALVLNNALFGNRFVIDALRNVRDDIFVVYAPILLGCIPNDVDANIKADLVIRTDLQRFGESYVMQAISMGADTIAHYSFPRLMAVPAFAARRDAMKAAAAREGISFIEIESIDAWSNTFGHVPMFIMQDLPRQVERLGVNTAFFATDCGVMPLPMITQIIATGAIFVNLCCPSPFLWYPEAVGIEHEALEGESIDFGIELVGRIPQSELIRAVDEAVDAAGMGGRISGWAVSDSMMWTTIGFMYAVEWLNGDVPQERGVIDVDVLGRLASEYAEQLGVSTAVTLETLTQDGEAIGHYVLGSIGYHVFGS